MTTEIQALSVQVRTLISVIEGMKESLDLLLKERDRTYTLKEFCRELNISHQTLKKFYELYKLPITRPYSVKGKRTVFSHKDLLVVKEFLHAHK